LLGGDWNKKIKKKVRKSPRANANEKIRDGPLRPEKKLLGRGGTGDRIEKKNNARGLKINKGKPKSRTGGEPEGERPAPAHPPNPMKDRTGETKSQDVGKEPGAESAKGVHRHRGEIRWNGETGSEEKKERCSRWAKQRALDMGDVRGKYRARPDVEPKPRGSTGSKNSK